MDKTLKVGDKALLSNAFTEEEVFQFANISSDKNPIHLDSLPTRDNIVVAEIVGLLKIMQRHH